MDGSWFWLVNYVWDDVWSCLGEEILWFGGDLREIWRFEGFWLWRFLESGLRDERCLCWGMKEEGKKFRYMGCRGRARPCHYRHGPCQASGVFGGLQGMGWHGRVTAGTGRTKLLAFWAQILFCFSFSWILLEQLPTKQLKTNKKRLNAWVASHETLV